VSAFWEWKDPMNAVAVLDGEERGGAMPEVAGSGDAADGSAVGAARILVVDDVAENREILRRYLAKNGFVVDAACGGGEALAMLDVRRYDAVLLDVMMPEVGGYEVLRTIRRTRAAAELPVIMATVLDTSEQVVKALEMGANDYVTKPLDFSVVLARVRTQVAIRQKVQQINGLKGNLAERNRELCAANEQMTADLEAAAKVQKSLLPVAPPAVPGYGFAWAFAPSATLAGDLLNVFRLDERRVGFFVLDVSGHGVAAALLSVTVSRFLSATPDSSSILWRETSGGYELASPARVADRLNRRFPFQDETNQFLTMVYGILDEREDEVRYVSAGHPDVLVVSPGGECRSLDRGGCPIGLSAGPYEESRVRLGEGDRVYVYSDGIPEALSAAGEQFGRTRMMRLLCDARGLALDESVGLLCAEVRAWSGRATPGDDQTVLALERLG
jgi:phosphoserine phosphatase RsbU/P